MQRRERRRKEPRLVGPATGIVVRHGGVARDGGEQREAGDREKYRRKI
jgi:hypothetical protein